MPIFSRFGADFFTVYADFSRFIRDINGEKKNISLLMIFFTVSFSRFAPSRAKNHDSQRRDCAFFSALKSGTVLHIPGRSP